MRPPSFLALSSPDLLTGGRLFFGSCLMAPRVHRGDAHPPELGLDGSENVSRGLDFHAPSRPTARDHGERRHSLVVPAPLVLVPPLHPLIVLPEVFLAGCQRDERVNGQADAPAQAEARTRSTTA